MHTEYFEMIEITDDVLESKGEEFNGERPTSEGAEALIGRYFKYLDYGHVCLLDYMGNDDTISASARISYGKGTKKINNNSNLLARLAYDRHTSPCEQPHLRLHLKIPIFVMRQLVRHRTANLNEYSARYSELTDEFYIPELDDLKMQSKTNKQGRSEDYDANFAKYMHDLMIESYNNSYETYKIANEGGLTRELARLVMPVGGYTEVVWTMDFHNLSHFLKLRQDKHAQKEIRNLAGLIANIVKEWLPVAHFHFERIHLNGVHFTQTQMVELAAALIDRRDVFERLNQSADAAEIHNKETGEEVIPPYVIREWKILSDIMINMIDEVKTQMENTADVDFNPEEDA